MHGAGCDVDVVRFDGHAVVDVFDVDGTDVVQACGHGFCEEAGHVLCDDDGGLEIAGKLCEDGFEGGGAAGAGADADEFEL